MRYFVFFVFCVFFLGFDVFVVASMRNKSEKIKKCFNTVQNEKKEMALRKKLEIEMKEQKAKFSYKKKNFKSYSRYIHTIQF